MEVKVKEFLSERDLDDLGLASRGTRARWIADGLLPPPLKPGGPNGRRFYTPEHIQTLKAIISGKRRPLVVPAS
jgi:DNA-binding transcriptional MerR regulator